MPVRSKIISHVIKVSSCLERQRLLNQSTETNDHSYQATSRLGSSSIDDTFCDMTSDLHRRCKAWKVAVSAL